MSARYGIFGHPVAHSLSPLLHTAGFRALGVDATYERFDRTPHEFARTFGMMITEGLVGGNVTAPLKMIVWQSSVTETTPQADEAAAVNTLLIDGSRIVGHNTDGDGFVRFLARAGAHAAGSSFVFLGAGGAAAGLSEALLRSGAKEIALVARRPGHVVELTAAEPEIRIPWLAWGSPEARSAIERADVVVQATPLGSSADDALPCPVAWVSPQALGVDLLYHPAESPWLAGLRARGVRAANGLGLLVEQALLAQAFWFGEEPPRSALEGALPWCDPFTAPPATSHEPPGASPPGRSTD